MITLVKSKYFNEIVSYLTLQRLKKEIDKILHICQSVSCGILISEMQDILENYVEPEPQIDLTKDDVDTVDTIDLCSIADALDE